MGLQKRHSYSRINFRCQQLFLFAVLLPLTIMKEISVVIPVMNEEENIKPLLEAVHNALSHLDYEVVLVDDGSTDDTRKRIIENADERVKFLKPVNKYLSAHLTQN